MYGGVSSKATVSSVFLGLAAFCLVLVVGLLMRAARALVEEPAGVEAAQATGRRRKELEREKASLLKALKELEFDHDMGKVSDPDFREIGGQYRARAMRVLRQLDEQGADYKALVEKELKARLAVPSVAGASPEPEQAEKKAPDGICVSCSTKNDPDAVFCKKCGKKVAA
jgi:ribosomal protein L40E